MSFIGDRLSGAAPDWALTVMRYSRQHRVVPNLIRPKSFNEKILHRILFDRRTWMETAADKYGVRDYVLNRVGAKILPELYHVTVDPKTIPFACLPKKFVIKPTHGSGWVEIVQDKEQASEACLVAVCKTWLSQSYYKITREWMYKNIVPRILVEEFIDDGNGLAPNDYKLFVFDGRVEFILVTMGRFDVRSHLFLDRNWKPVDVTFAYSNLKKAVLPPPHLDEMIGAAESLARGIDFVRIDFYDNDTKLFFGEMTATPGCGLDRFQPTSFDTYLGSFWKVERVGWRSAAWERRLFRTGSVAVEPSGPRLEKACSADGIISFEVAAQGSSSTVSALAMEKE